MRKPYGRPRVFSITTALAFDVLSSVVQGNARGWTVGTVRTWIRAFLRTVS